MKITVLLSHVEFTDPGLVVDEDVGLGVGDGASVI